MSNNMYDILGKLASLEPKQEEKATESKPIYESVEARGSIVAGVKDVEQRLREQFEAMGEEQKVYRHKGTYGNEYDPGDDGTKKPKHVPKKGVKGRPKKEKPAEIKAPKGDIFGRTTGKVPKGKGTVVKGKAMSHDVNKHDDEELDEVAKNPYAVGMAQAKKEVGLGRAKASGLPKKVVKRAHHIGDVIKSQTNEGKRSFMKQLSEGVNFSEMMKEKDRTIGELLAELQADIKAFKETGHCSDFLRDCMEVHGYGKKQLQDAVTPRGPSFAPQHPATPEPQRGMLGKAFDKVKSVGQKALDIVAPGDDELLSQLEKDTGGKRPNRYNENEELNELARLAGLQVAEAAKPDFRDVDDDGNKKESWKDAEEDKMDEGNDGNLANNAKPYDKVTRRDVIQGAQGKDEEGGKKVDECMSPLAGGAVEMHQAEQQKGRMSVNTSADSEGHKTVTITADGDEAEKLAQLLALAGLGGHSSPEREEAAIVVAQEAKDYGDTDVEEAPEAMNKPRPDVRGAHRAETVGFANTSDDLHKQKDQHPDAAAKGDNPLTKKEKAVEGFNPLDSLGAKLMAEYQSIKIQK